MNNDLINNTIKKSNDFRTAVLLTYELNLDSIESLDDCKNILKFLCNTVLKPLPYGTMRNGFEDVKKYFNVK